MIERKKKRPGESGCFHAKISTSTGFDCMTLLCIPMGNDFARFGCQKYIQVYSTISGEARVAVVIKKHHVQIQRKLPWFAARQPKSIFQVLTLEICRVVAARVNGCVVPVNNL